MSKITSTFTKNTRVITKSQKQAKKPSCETKLLSGINSVYNSTPLKRNNNLVKYIKKEIMCFKKNVQTAWNNIVKSINSPETEKKLSDQLTWLMENNK
jgi:hypothetical protein